MLLVSSDGAMQQYRKWLTDCTQRHKECPSPKAPLLPRRVIDVAMDSPDEKPVLHISSIGERAQYAALSYCWGSSGQTLQTTTSNVAEMMRGLDVSTLPKTIQDAITTTRKLGIQYLWIDAFSILQDDDLDKASQIENMGSIYKNATVTIAASTASAVSEGFLANRKEVNIGYCQLPFLLPNGQSGEIMITLKENGYRPDHPLNRRAWTLQEFMLSSRLLMFGEREVTWHCQSQRYKGTPFTHFSYDYSRELVPLMYAPLGMYDSLERYSRIQKADHWRNILQNYCRRDLKLPTDRLPALAGVARELATLWKDTYIAGMWRDCIVFNLCWTFVRSGDQPVLDDAPSWSWLSAPLPCSIMSFDVEKPLLEVIDCHAEPKWSEAPFGEVKGGKLIVRGKLIYKAMVENDFWPRPDISPDGATDLSGNDALHFLLVGYTEKTQAPVIKRRRPWTNKKATNERTLIGLMLERLESGDFKRTGVFCHFDTEEVWTKAWQLAAVQKVCIV